MIFARTKCHIHLVRSCSVTIDRTFSKLENNVFMLHQSIERFIDGNYIYNNRFEIM